MKKTFLPIFIFIIILAAMIPTAALAVDPPEANPGLVPSCEGADCDFSKLMDLVANVIDFTLTKMVVPIAAIMFAYAGFLMVTSAGSTESRSKAKSIFTNTILGLVMAMAAWLIIKLILTILGWDGSWIGF